MQEPEVKKGEEVLKLGKDEYILQLQHRHH
jgi:hypothetical protein